jgi:acetyl esterase/lipase
LPAPAEQEPLSTRREDVIYGRKYGTALTLDVFTPTKGANGLGVIYVVSGGWVSAHELIHPPHFAELLHRGYTVFAVVHGSQPKYVIPEILPDLHRAVRFVRFYASKYQIDPDRIGITGGSAGGHLSLMQGTTGKDGDPKAKDPIERVSSRVQAVACFFPPTDFLNYGEKGRTALGHGTLRDFKAPFDFHELDPKTRAFVPITDDTRRREIGRNISPIYHISAESAPTLIIHGDADHLVPLQQSQSFIAKLKVENVPAELIVKPGLGHGWPAMEEDRKKVADWFDKYLGPSDPGAPDRSKEQPQTRSKVKGR